MNVIKPRHEHAMFLCRLALMWPPLDVRGNQRIAALLNTLVLNTGIKDRP